MEGARYSTWHDIAQHHIDERTLYSILCDTKIGENVCHCDLCARPMSMYVSYLCVAVAVEPYNVEFGIRVNFSCIEWCALCVLYAV